MARKKSSKKRSKAGKPRAGLRTGGKKRRGERRGSERGRRAAAELERIADQEDDDVRLAQARRQRARDRGPVMNEPELGPLDPEDPEDDDRSIVPLPWERHSAPEPDADESAWEPRPAARAQRSDPGAKKSAKKIAKKLYPKLAEQGLDRLLDKLDRARQPLFKEWREVLRAVKNDPVVDDDPHVFCTRKYNQMRITDLEALSIARAFRDDIGLRRRRRDVVERVAEELRRLKRGRRRQNFTCPLLDGENCMVHQSAKPIGCLAWQPAGEPSEAGWRAFNQRNHYNDRMINIDWDIAAIPLALEKYLDGEMLEPGKVRVSEPHRRRTRHVTAREVGRGRRGTARLSERDRRRAKKKKRSKKKSAKKGAKKAKKRASRRGAGRHAATGGRKTSSRKKSSRKSSSLRKRS